MGIVLFVVFAITLVIGVPIALTLAAGSIAALVFSGKISLFVVGQKLFSSVDSFSLMAIPFFMLAGAIMSSGGISRRLINLANSIVGWLPGGLGIVAVLSSMFFGALSGSPTATCAAIGSIMAPALLERGYGIKFVLSTIAVSGILGSIIPPSTTMITYSSATDASIGDMFMGGIIPGMLLTLFLTPTCLVYGIKRKIPRQSFAINNLLTSFKESIGALLMPVIILGGIYGGIFTPTESAAVACAYGIIVGVFIYRELKFKELHAIFISAASSAGMVMFIISAAGIFGYIMAREQIPAAIANFMLGISSDQIIFLFLVNILLLIIGCFLETTAAILILAPILYPTLSAYGINPVHFGIIMCVNLAIGMVTPPLGVNLYVAAGLQKEKIETIVNKYLFIYIGSMLFALAIITYIPEIVMLLPSLSKH